MIERYLEMRDGHRLFLRCWNDVSCEPVATLHINHGMAEHSLRYDDFARYLNARGIVVYAQDHRGHGLTKEEEEKGWFAPSDGWSVVTGDAIAVDQLVMNEYENLPHFVMGHSMGSFITRTVLTKVSDYFSAAIIMGTGSGQGIKGSIGKAIASSHVRKHGSRMPDHMMNRLSFGSYNNHFKPVRTEYDWLTRDENEVQKYIDDPLCGFVCSSQFYVDLLTGIEIANDRKLARKVSPVLPMLIVSGSDDPVGGYGKGIRKVCQLYEDAGLYDVRMKLFEHDRHEILNELDKKEVYAYLADYLNEMLERIDS